MSDPGGQLLFGGGILILHAVIRTKDGVQTWGDTAVSRNIHCSFWVHCGF